MFGKNETLKILLALIISFGFLVVIWVIFGDRLIPTKNQNTSNSFQKSSNINLKDRLSNGDKLLISTNSTPQKELGIKSLANKDYATAIEQLETSLKINYNDPEALIYLHNARIGEQKFYEIAVAIPISSDVDGAQEILRGIAQAQSDINSKDGINGYLLKVTIVDDNNDPEIAKQLAQELAKKPSILGVVGHWASDVTLATAPIYEGEKLVVISPISTSVKLSGFGKYIYRTVISDRFAGSALSRYQINNLKKKKTAIFYNSQSGYSQSLKDEFTSALYADGGEIVAEIDLSKADFNAGRDFPQILSKGAEVIMLATNTATLDQSLQVIQVNDRRLPILGGDDAYASKILEIGGKDALNMVVAIPWHVLAYPNYPFVKNSQSLWRSEINWRTAMAYDAVMALAEAMKVNASRTGIQESLSNPDFNAKGATSNVRFLPSGDRNQPVQLVKVAKTNNVNLPYRFIPIK